MDCTEYADKSIWKLVNSFFTGPAKYQNVFGCLVIRTVICFEYFVGKNSKQVQPNHDKSIDVFIMIHDARPKNKIQSQN